MIADPSHGTAGTDGLMIEVHPRLDHALKDGAQSLTFDNFEQLVS